MEHDLRRYCFSDWQQLLSLPSDLPGPGAALVAKEPIDDECRCEVWAGGPGVDRIVGDNFKRTGRSPVLPFQAFAGDPQVPATQPVTMVGTPGAVGPPWPAAGH